MNNKNKNIYKRDWKAINYGSIKKIEVLFNKKFLKQEKNRLKALNINKEGARYKYSNKLIEIILFIKYYFRFDFRRTQSILYFFKKILNFPVPDYTTLARRQSAFEPYLKHIYRYKNKFLRVAIDGSGFSKTNRGEWLRLVHKKG